MSDPLYAQFLRRWFFFWQDLFVQYAAIPKMQKPDCELALNSFPKSWEPTLLIILRAFSPSNKLPLGSFDPSVIGLPFFTGGCPTKISKTRLLKSQMTNRRNPPKSDLKRTVIWNGHVAGIVEVFGKLQNILANARVYFQAVWRTKMP